MRRTLTLCLTLSLPACSDMPHVVWPDTQAAAQPSLLPLDEILGPQTPMTDTRGAALAAEAAALRARAARIGT